MHAKEINPIIASYGYTIRCANMTVWVYDHLQLECLAWWIDLWGRKGSYESSASTLRVASSRRYKWLNLASTDKQERGRWNPRAGYDTLSLIGTFAMSNCIASQCCSPFLRRADPFESIISRNNPRGYHRASLNLIRRLIFFRKSGRALYLLLSCFESYLMIASLNEHF